MRGVVRTQFSSQIILAGAVVGNLTAAGNGATALSANATTVLSLPQIVFFGNKGYSITVLNQSGQNNTVTIDLSFEDEAVAAGG